MINHTDLQGILYEYDELHQLVSAHGSIKTENKCPDAIGNLYTTEKQTDRHYGKGGQLQYDGKWHYYYDAKGNLIQKSPNQWHDPKKAKEWHTGCWQYEWNANGSLKSVALPSGKAVYFEYDALGRRTAKIVLTDNKRTIHRYLWDGNVLLQEWHYDLKDRPKQVIDELGEISYDREEPIENLITWLYEEGTFTPIGKIENGETYYIVNDYLGTPTQAFNTEGELIWRRELDIYGKARYLKGEEDFIPFRYQGQYYDKETQLCYNRFRYYSPETGLYISQDPIGLAGNNPNFYAYVKSTNSWVDIFGLLGELQKLAKEISESGDHFFSRVLRVVAVGKDSKGNLFAASSNGLDFGQTQKAIELNIIPLNSSTVFVDGKNLHAEEVLMKEISDLKEVGTYKRTPCGIDEHNCLGQLKDKGIKIDCN